MNSSLTSRRQLIEPVAAVAHPINVNGEPSRAKQAGLFTRLL